MAWTNTGGGDHNGEDWTPGNGETIGGTHTNIGSFTITSGFTVDIFQGSALKIYADDIDVDGTLNGNSKGYAGGSSTYSGSGPGGGTGTDNTGEGAGGGGYGGAGGRGGDQGAYGGSAYGSSSDSIVQMGSGGGGSYHGAGGNGGGSVFLNACTVDIDGTINLNGGVGFGHNTGAGGGSGGGLCVLCKTLVCTSATITCNGGAGGTAGDQDGGGGGGGGRVKFFLVSTDVFDPLTKTTVTAGVGGVPGGSTGTIGTEQIYHSVGHSKYTYTPGQVINFGIMGVIPLTKITLNVVVVTTSGNHQLTIYDSPSKIINYGSKILLINSTGEVTFEFDNVVILPDGMRDYYFEVVSYSGGADSYFQYAANNKYNPGHMYYSNVLLDGLDLYMKIYTYPHIINPSVYNVSDRSMKCDVADIMLTGASHRINADGSGHIDYDDDFITDKYSGDLAGISGVTYDDPGNDLDIAAGGYIYYKLNTKFPILGIPTLTSLIHILTGTPTIQIAEDTGGQPAGWYDIRDSIVDNVNTEYELDADDLNLEGKTILYFRIDCAGTATASLRSFNLDIDLNTSTAQIPAVDKGGAANIFRCDQDNTSSIDSTITLHYNDAKQAG